MDPNAVDLSNFRVYPNPFRDRTTLSLNSTGDTELNLKIKSFYTGQIVYDEVATIMSGDNQLPLELSHLRRGFYVLFIKNSSNGVLEKRILLFKK